MVRVPVDTRTDEIFEDIDVDLTPNASSLHLVDLAGSERAARTNAHVSIFYDLKVKGKLIERNFDQTCILAETPFMGEFCYVE